MGQSKQQSVMADPSATFLDPGHLPRGPDPGLRTLWPQRS